MPDEYADLKAWLGSRKKCVGFKSGPSEDGGHMVCEAQFEPDPKAQEALAALKALQARVAEFESAADQNEPTKLWRFWNDRALSLYARLQSAEARVAELEAENARSSATLNLDLIERMVEVLEDMRNTIKNSDHWWMDDPRRGGFDLDNLDAALTALTAFKGE
jgi:hypothetical protein